MKAREQTVPVGLRQNSSKAESDQAWARVNRLDMTESGGTLTNSNQQSEYCEQDQRPRFGSQEEQAGKEQIEEHFKIQTPAQQQQRRLGFKRRYEQQRLDQALNRGNGGPELRRH